MREVRLEKLTQLVHRRASEVITYEMNDPRMGFVTISRVKLSGDLRYAVIYYSVVGSDSDRSKTEHALEHAQGHIQSEIARAMHTRVTPIVRFEYDEGVAGSIRVSQLIDELREERGEQEELSTAAEEEE
jgi:ribosome-binding factor A